MFKESKVLEIFLEVIKLIKIFWNDKTAILSW